MGSEMCIRDRMYDSMKGTARRDSLRSGFAVYGTSLLLEVRQV